MKASKTAAVTTITGAVLVESGAETDRTVVVLSKTGTEASKTAAVLTITGAVLVESGQMTDKTMFSLPTQYQTAPGQ